MKNFNSFLKYKTFFYCLFISFIFISCSDSEDTSSTSSLLTNAWDVVVFQSKLPSETTWTDSSTTCNLDDTWEFTNSGEIIIYGGSFLCDGDTNFSNTIYDFKLAANDTKIIFTIAGYEYEENIEELTETTLITTYALGTTNNAEGRRIFSRAE